MKNASARTRRSEDGIPRMFSLDIRAMGRFLVTQPLSFWCLNLYLFIEYVRPQQVWTAIDVLPWGLLSIVLTVAAFALEGRMPRVRTVAGGLLIGFTVILIASSVSAVYPQSSYQAWELFFTWVLVFFLITNIVTTEQRFFVFALAFLLYSFKMSQHGFRSWAGMGFAFSDWGVTGGPGWFHNSGEFGIQMALFLPLSVEFILAFRKHWGWIARWFFYLMPVTAVAGMVASSSRGALIGGASVALWWVIRSKHRVRALLAMALVGFLTWTVVPPEQKIRFTTAGSDDTSISRLDRWEAGIDMANQYPILGIGYNNWGAYYGPLSHNIFIQAWSELGYTGLLAFLALIGATFYVNFQTRRIIRRSPTSTKFLWHMAHGLDGALIGYLASGFFVTVLYYPYFWINLAMTVALHATARHERRRLRRAGGAASARDTYAVRRLPQSWRHLEETPAAPGRLAAVPDGELPGAG